MDFITDLCAAVAGSNLLFLRLLHHQCNLLYLRLLHTSTTSYSCSCSTTSATSCPPSSMMAVLLLLHLHDVHWPLAAHMLDHS
jgi:hypothetical protein